MNFWSVTAILAIGVIIGLFIGAKYINTPQTEVNLRKIKIKGENTVTVPEIFENPLRKEKKHLLKKIFKRNKNEKTD